MKYLAATALIAFVFAGCGHSAASDESGPNRLALYDSPPVSPSPEELVREPEEQREDRTEFAMASVASDSGALDPRSRAPEPAAESEPEAFPDAAFGQRGDAEANSPAPVAPASERGSTTGPGVSTSTEVGNQPAPPSSDPAPDFATLDLKIAGPARRGKACKVWLDGRMMGDTPVMALEVPLGQHDVRVSCGRRVDFSESLTFRPGDQLKVLVVRPGGAKAKRQPKRARRGKRRRRR